MPHGAVDADLPKANSCHLLGNKLIRTSRQLVQKIGHEPLPDEIAERMELPLEKVRRVLKIAKEPSSLEKPHQGQGAAQAAAFWQGQAVEEHSGDDLRSPGKALDS